MDRADALRDAALDERGEEGTIVDQRDAAESAGLVYVNDDEPGIRRRKSGTGFSYRNPDGSTVKDPATLARIRKLAIPPAYTDVWICTDPNGHIQATGRDDKGRKQYRYHQAWRELRDSTKYEHMFAFAKALPALRARVETDMARRGLPREKVVATVVHLLENTLIRVGNADYAKQNKSYGLTTLRDRHVKIEGAQLRFEFKGKSGKTWKLQVKDRRLAKVVKACQEGTVETVDGETIEIPFESICFHSDTPGSYDVIKAIRAALDRAGIKVVPLPEVLAAS